MNRILALLAFSTASLLAVAENLNTFEADFIQTIINDKNSTLRYSGHLYAKRPNLGRWNYTKPIQKELYINGNHIVIVDDELEQATQKYIDSDFNILELLQHAKQISDTLFKSEYKQRDFLITIKDNIIESIAYSDDFDNSVVVDFEAQQMNQPLKDTLFLPKIPKSYDIIK